MEMICPKAKECKFKCLDKKPHEYSDTCKQECKLLGGTCIEYTEPEPIKINGEPEGIRAFNDYGVGEKATKICNSMDEFIVKEEYEEEPAPINRLVKLPPKETIKGILRQEVVIDEETITERSDTWKSHGGCMHEDYIDTLTEQIYASAKPVDIEKLAEKITFDVVGEVEPHIADDIKQAIEEFIKE